MEKDLEIRIQSYINSEMSGDEKQAFEQELAVNEALRRELKRQQILEKAIGLYGDQMLAGAAAAVRQKSGPLPAPEITPMDRLRYFLRWNPLRIWVPVGVLVLAGIGLLWYANSGAIKPVPQLVPSYLIPPRCLGVAGAAEPSAANARKDLETASAYYCGKKVEADSLARQMKASGGFSMAEYYLAHIDCVNGNYKNAETEFSHCLAEQALITRFRELSGEIPNLRLNYILARLGAGKNAGEVMPDLEALIRETNETINAHEKAMALRAELKNPLRRLIFN